MSTKILIVDDEPELLESMSSWLKEEGFVTSCASNDDEFQKKVFSDRPHLIILDIMLGSKNGVQVYEKLVGLGLDRTIPVIFLSGLAKDRPASSAGPGRTYVLHSKPFIPDELLKEIRCLVGN